jgi:Gram-negative bacterial TonB protein C-terminal
VVRAALINAAGLMLTVAALPAAAQSFLVEPSAATRCLMPEAEQRGLPEYPFEDWKRGHKGRVLVELSFTSADQRPAVKVLESEGDGDSERRFVSAIREHVATYRVPCLDQTATTPSRLQLEFVFRPDQREARSSVPVEPGRERIKELMKCVVHSSGTKPLDYPPEARRANLQGRVLARLRFDSADKAPQAQVMSRPSARPLAAAVETFIKGYRMPCFSGDEAVETTYSFFFVLEGEGAYGFRPMDLLSFMASVQGIRKQALQFDTTAMGCPFEVQFQYRQPYMANAVGEFDNNNPARRPLLNWLANQHLDLPRRALDSVFADQTVITVPCAKINLKPQETS